MSQAPPPLGVLLALAANAIMWGAAFPAMKYALSTTPAPVTLTLRFTIAGLCVLPWARGQLGHRGARRGGATLGLVMLAIFAALSLGIRHMSAPRCAFLMAMTMVFVQAGEAIARRRIDPVEAVAAALSLVGVALVTGWVNEPPTAWDILVLSAAFLSALGLRAVHRISAQQGMPAVALTFWQLATLAAGAALSWLWRRPPAWEWQLGPALALLFLGAFPSALAQLLQMLYQRHASPSVAAMIYALKPLFATLIATLLFGELLRGQALAGGGMMIAAAFGAPFVSWRRQLRAARRQPR